MTWWLGGGDGIRSGRFQCGLHRFEWIASPLEHIKFGHKRRYYSLAVNKYHMAQEKKGVESKG